MQSQKKAYLFALSAVLFWSTIASAFKITLYYLDFIQILFFASIVSCLVFFTILLAQNKISQLRSLKPVSIVHAAIRGLLNPFLYYLLSSCTFHDHAQGYANGTTVIHLSRKAIPEFKFQMPDEKLLKKFEQLSDELLKNTNK